MQRGLEPGTQDDEKERHNWHTSFSSSESAPVLVALSEEFANAEVSAEGAVVIRTPLGEERI
jgi:hypothetical protein